jgi:hypothetical protein
VLPLATGIGETEVNELDFVLFHHLHHVCDGLGHQILLVGKGVKNLRSAYAVSVPTLAQTRTSEQPSIVPLTEGLLSPLLEKSRQATTPNWCNYEPFWCN